MFRSIALLAAAIVAFSGCASTQTRAGHVMMIVKLRTTLDDETFLKIAHEREPRFAANPAILQKYYIKLDKPGHYGGVYIWESAGALQEFRSSELAATIAETYKGIERPTIEIMDIMFQLRD